MVDMILIFDHAVCGYTLAYYWYDIDVGTPRAILEANGNFGRIQPFKNFPHNICFTRNFYILIHEKLLLLLHFFPFRFLFEVSCVVNYNHFYHRNFYRKRNLNFHCTKTAASSHHINNKKCSILYHEKTGLTQRFLHNRHVILW